MAVPAHDERDLQFAETFDLPVVTVIDEDGRLVNSQEFDGLPFEEAKKAIVEKLRAEGKGAPAVSYRLRDWSMSRQRYWGCPIPIVHCPTCGPVAVPDDQLPVLLPEVEDYRPKGVPPLASNKEWLHTECPQCGGPAEREADTMDTFVDSSWYFLRYVDPRNEESPFDRRVVDYWCADLALHRRDRPRDRPPALLALLRQGDERDGHARLPRAVRPPLPPGLGADGRLEDVEVEGQRLRPGRARRGLRRRRGAPQHPLHGPRRPGHGVDGRRDRGDEPVRAAAVARRQRGRRAGARGHGWSAGAPRPRDDPARQRRPRPPHAVPHADLGGDGAGQRPGRLARRARARASPPRPRSRCSSPGRRT